jgi:hypothetical protein
VCADSAAAGRRNWRASEASVILWEAAEKRRPSRITLADHGGLEIGRSRHRVRSPYRPSHKRPR